VRLKHISWVEGKNRYLLPVSKTGAGKFITVEGQDGAGKTTNIKFIEDVLRGYGFDVYLTREPGGTDLGEILRRLVLQEHELHIDALAELLIIFAARAQHLSERILPALSTGAWVLCDRFTDATFAYQSGGRGLPWSHVEVLERMVQGDLRPDLTVLLDVDPETGVRRTRQRSNTEPDRFEAQKVGFRRKVRKAYLDLAQSDPGRIRIVDASAAVRDVQVQIRRVIERFIGDAGTG